jgi:hypothetical protein
MTCRYMPDGYAGRERARKRAGVSPSPCDLRRFPSPEMGEGFKINMLYSLSPRGRDRSCSGNAVRQRRITTRVRVSCIMTNSISFPAFSERLKECYPCPYCAVCDTMFYCEICVVYFLLTTFWFLAVARPRGVSRPPDRVTGG